MALPRAALELEKKNLRLNWEMIQKEHVYDSHTCKSDSLVLLCQQIIIGGRKKHQFKFAQIVETSRGFINNSIAFTYRKYKGIHEYSAKKL